MKSTQFIETLEAIEQEPDRLEGETSLSSRFFIFSIGELKLALPPEQVHEIVCDLEIHALPACPPYIAGLINCHGYPYAVLDLHVLFRSERHGVDKFLVLKMDADSVAIGCTEVNEIVDIPLSQVSTFADKDTDGRFCSAVFEYQGDRILVLSVAHVLSQLEQDLG